MSNGKLSNNAVEVAEDRYFMEGEDWESCSGRVGSVVAGAENANALEYAEKFSEMIYNMDFLPGGRILRNAGRPRGSMFNCYHLPMGDSREEIGQFYKDSLILWGEGGGIGVNASFLRPKGAEIKGLGGESSGPVSFLKASDAIAETVESGGSRRAAALALMHVSHPDILRFIDAKLEHGELVHYNISVAVSEDFLAAVESNIDWEFKFAQKTYGKIKARKIWNKIIDNMVKCAEPGLLNWDNLIKNNSYYYDPVMGTNPCLVGNSMVYVADGRQYVDIKTLAEENKDVPVFCFNGGTQKVEVQMMRRPRLTGKNKKILKVTLNDGSIVRCTENHKFYTKDGSTKRADKLVNGDRLHHMVSNPSNKGYMWLFNPLSGASVEHRIVAEYKLERVLNNDEVVHHKNYNKLDNNPNNLEVMTKKEHDALHAKDMLGDKNPMNRFPEKNWLIKQDHSGCNNGRYKGVTPECVFNRAVEYSKELNRRITQDEWCDYCLLNDTPLSLYSFGEYTCLSKMLLAAAKKARVIALEYSAHIREYKKFLKLIKETDMDIFFDGGGIYVNKICEWCGDSFITKWGNRERAFCSRKCSSDYGWSNEDSRNKFYSHYENKQQKTRINQINIYNTLRKNFERTPLKKEWSSLCKKIGVPYRIRSSNESEFNEYCFTSYKDLQQAAELNFIVVSVEEDGYEDVYNGTVDGNHNFYTKTSECVGNNGKTKYNHILISNCGEAVLSPYDVCDLGSLVLTNFITGTVNTNWKKLYEVIKIAVRFLDDVIEINKYVLKEIDIKAHNSRRIGLGVMGLAEYLFAKKLRYGSERSVIEIERLMRFIRDTVYETLIELADEKGAFPKFEPVAYGKASFIRKLPASLRMDIKDHGVRCVTGMAIAPTGCQRGDSLVVTSDGILKLTEIGDEGGAQWQSIDIKVAQENCSYKKATKFFINGEVETKKISLSSGMELECTFNHKYRVLRNKNYVWSRADKLVAGDLFVVPLNTYFNDNDRELKLPVVTHGNQNAILVHSHMNFDLAEFLGIYYGDGSNHNKGIRISCNAHNKNDYMYVANLGQRLFNIKPTFENNDRGCMAVCFNSQVLLNWLCENKLLKQKSKDIEIPNLVRTSSRNSLIGFVKGICFADGSINKSSGVIFFNTSSKKLALQLITIFRSLGSDAAMDRQLSGKGSIIFRVRLVKTTRRCLTDDIRIALFKLGLSFNCTIDKVVSVEDSLCKTFDIEVPETVTYISNSVISHNTISLLAEVTSGIEPLFRKAYLRHDRIGDRMYVHPIYKDMLNNGGKLEDWYVDTDDLSPEDHFEMQSIVQKYVDGAVSKTINMPTDTTSKELSRLSLEYIRDLKGVTVYVDGSREGQILNKVTDEEARIYLANGELEIIDAGEESVICATSSCEI